MKIAMQYNLAFFLLLAVLPQGYAWAVAFQEQTKAQAAEITEPNADKEHPPLTPEKIEKEKEEARTVGLLLIVLIIFLGACSILFAMFWGYRVRRLVRNKKSTPTQLDEFWYLRPAQKQVTTSSLEDNSVGEDEHNHPEEN